MFNYLFSIMDWQGSLGLISAYLLVVFLLGLPLRVHYPHVLDELALQSKALELPVQPKWKRFPSAALPRPKECEGAGHAPRIGQNSNLNTLTQDTCLSA